MIMMDVRVAQVSYWSRSRVESFCYRNARSLTTTGKPQALDGAGCTTLTADVSFRRVLNGAGCTTLTADVAKADVEPGRSPNAATTISIALSLKFAMMSACSLSLLPSQ